ncbi:hypothetical protein NLJ89_g6888 [Agrocybe chaxingu]|uniref:Uncharacterized protein n=1 Tax=Agrocybe chaxingu TaxID=84603 RepID=A0A9W8K016_9AGAR|nr:hypothetical protein NLJ89_g6888 [Agrocybe chaxingu]
MAPTGQDAPAYIDNTRLVITRDVEGSKRVQGTQATWKNHALRANSAVYTRGDKVLAPRTSINTDPHLSLQDYTYKLQATFPEIVEETNLSKTLYVGSRNPNKIPHLALSATKNGPPNSNFYVRGQKVYIRPGFGPFEYQIGHNTLSLKAGDLIQLEAEPSTSSGARLKEDLSIPNTYYLQVYKVELCKVTRTMEWRSKHAIAHHDLQLA